uniref:PID domain-containing protein n=1 Tax=Panagrellus redivivus TaxID=6233 RepID=A0A7E4VHT0_PANRE
MPSLGASPAREFFTMPFRKKKMYTINPPDDLHSVTYLGNVLTIMGKGEQSIEKPLALIWKAYCSKSQRHELAMKLLVTRSGLKAETKLQGLTEYWAHRITFCCAPPEYPKLFCWVYKHDGKKMKPELRCHAVLCRKASEPAQIAERLQDYLASALQEYKREKRCIEKARKVSAQAGGHQLGPRRKLLLQSGSLNFRPPVSRSKSAPRLGSIDEEDEIEEPHGSGMQDYEYEETFEDEETASESASIAYPDHRATPLGGGLPMDPSLYDDEDDEDFQNGESSSPGSPASSISSFKRQLSMSSASKRRHASQPPLLALRLGDLVLNDDDNEDDEEEEMEPSASGTDAAQAPSSSSCASSDDGFASSCQSGDLDNLHRNQRASLRRRLKALTEPDSISDESGYHEAANMTSAATTSSTPKAGTSPRSSQNGDFSDVDDPDDDFDAAAITAQRLLTGTTTIDLEPNVQITAL